MGEGEADEDGVVEASLEPGTMQRLKPGQDVRFAEPADAGSSYEGFFRNQLRAVATAAGVTYEQLSGDLTQVNYSSIRAGAARIPPPLRDHPAPRSSSTSCAGRCGASG